MEATWFALLAFMFIVYVVLDGFDFGAGIVHHFVADTDEERRTVLAAIGPLWDGNEVWLIAGGGTLVFAFPRAYAAAFSGFYLPLMMVLWLLILRGVSIEFRSHDANPLWRSFWDAGFSLSSTVIAIVLGASLGNVIRGVPLDETGWFHVPLFTDLRARTAHPGALDWYTLTVGAFALVALAGHGALYLAWKTEGAVRSRSARLASRLWVVIALALVPVTLATHAAQPDLLRDAVGRTIAWLLALATLACLAGVLLAIRRRRERAAFLCSCGFLASLLGATAAAQFPIILPSTIAPAYDVTSHGAANGRHGLAVGLAWWIPALLLAAGYFAYLFRSLRGKVRLDDSGH